MKLTTPPLAPKVIIALSELNIHTVQELRTNNPCRIFLLLKKSGLSITQSVFWQLVALSLGKTASELSADERAFWQQQLHNAPPVAIFPPFDEMKHYMQMALTQAKLAAQQGEVPVGAVIVHQGKVIATAHNRCIMDCNVSHHAEILALGQAGQALDNYRLRDCDVYVSLEPCTMCASALIQARVARVIFAATEPRTGAAGSVLNVFADKKLNAHTAILGGILEDESRFILQDFFQKKR